MKPYYEDSHVTICHGDCRDTFIDTPILVTDPPYPNNAEHFDDAVEVACEYLSKWGGVEATVFWTELESPPCPLPLVGVHIWHRTNVNGRPYEPVYHFHRNGKKRRSDVLRAAAVFDGVGPGCDQYAGHPTQKNVSVMGSIIARLKEDGGAILDPFMGSGTTLVAAKKLGRKAIGIEIEERYCEIAAERCSQGVFDFSGSSE